MYRTVTVPLGHRALVRVDGRAVRFLGPGRHRVAKRPFARVDVELHAVGDVVARIAPHERALVPAGEACLVSLAPHERALVALAGEPRLWLGPGEHALWTGGRPPGSPGGIEVEVVDTRPLDAPVLPESIRAVVPASDYAEVAVPAGAVALRCVDGVIERELGPGRHAAWTTTRRVTFAVAVRVGCTHVLLGAVAPALVEPFVPACIAEGAA